MKKLLAVAAFAALFAFTSLADDLAKLEGKWSVKKSNEGRSYTQVLEISKGNFKFKLLRENDKVAIYAEGHVKIEQAGALHVVKFTDIKAGASESELSEIDDDRTSVYVLGDDTWTMATNFDKDRDGQKPSVDVYTKSAK